MLMVLALFIVNFVGTIFLETKMPQYFTLELVIIIVGILLSVISLVGIAAEARWAWPFSTILFSLLLANSVFLYVNVPAIITFLGLLVVNIFGLLVAIISIEDVAQSLGAMSPEVAPLETYPAGEPAQVTYNAPAAKAKSGRKRKK
jgi:hypothetical protein